MVKAKAHKVGREKSRSTWETVLRSCLLTEETVLIKNCFYSAVLDAAPNQVSESIDSTVLGSRSFF